MNREFATTFESVFRLTRADDGTDNLRESRELKRVDGKAWDGSRYATAATVQDAFSGGLSLVSLAAESCMRYELEPVHPGEAYVIGFETINEQKQHPSCLLREDATGHVLVDPASLQIEKLEFTVPQHVIHPGHRTPEGTVGKPLTAVWKVSVDYEPISIEDKLFWMPVKIDSKTTAGDVGDRTTWRYEADYDNFHKLEVTSRIVPGGGG